MRTNLVRYVIKSLNLCILMQWHWNICIVLYNYKKDYEKYFECKIDKNVRYTGIEWRILNFWSKTKSLFRYVFHIKGKMIRQNHEKLKAKVRGRRVCLLWDSFFRDFDALEKHREQVEYYFTFKPEIKSAIDIKITELRGGGIH